MSRLKALANRPMSAPALIVLVGVFVALFSNTAFFARAAEIYPPLDGNIVLIASMFVYLAALFTTTLAAVCHGRLTRPLLIGFLFLSAMIAYFMNQYGTIIDHRMIENILETNLNEAADLFSWQLLLYVALLGVLPSAFVWKVPLARKTWKRELLSRVTLATAALILMGSAYLAFSAHYAATFRAHRELWAQVNPTHALSSAIKLVRIAVKSRSYPKLIVGADAKIPEADVHRELVIMVVGETARADHFSLNGYKRETNPLLRKANVFNFPDFWSCATSTAESVPCIFSHYRRNEFDRHRARFADNALDVLKRAGVAILWRDNNSSSKHVADRVEYEQYLNPKKNPMCDSECRDEGMLVGLQEFIDAHPTGDVFIVLHQMGNHGPAYYKRYPPEFEKFKPVCKTNDLRSCSKEEVINAYDNAILYTDYVLSRVIGLLKRNDDTFETAMVYVSDHGESLGESGLYLHGLPYFLAPKEQRHVPFVMWFGRNFDKEYLGTMNKRRLDRLSHDNIFATLLGLFEIQSAAYDPAMDLLDHSKLEHW